MGQTKDFLSHLWRGGEYGNYWIKRTGRGGGLTTWVKAGDMQAPPKTGKGENLYFGVNPTTAIPPQNAKGEDVLPQKARSQNEYIASLSTLFAEFDAKDFEQGKSGAMAHIKTLPAPPSVIVDSGGGYHCYWLLDRPFIINDDNARTEATEAQAQWVAYCGGDNGAKDIARVLRVPGSVNYKAQYGPNYPTVHFVEYDLGRLYPYATLKALSTPPPIAPKATTTTKATTAPLARKTGTASNGGNGLSVIDLFNSQYRPSDILARNGYTEAGRGRWVAPQSSTGEAGVVVLDGKIYSHHGSDPLNNGHSHDPFSLFVELENGGNQAAALQSASELLADLLPRKVRSANGNGNVHHALNGGRAALYPSEAPSDAYLLLHSPDDNGNAECVAKRYEGQFLYTQNLGWLSYTGTHWQAEKSEAMLNRAVVETLKARQIEAVKAEKDAILKTAKPSATNTRNALYHLKAICAVDISHFDNDPDLLNVKNGVVNLRTGELSPHHHTQRFTYCIPYEYHPKAHHAPGAVLWYDFLNDSLIPDNAGVGYGELLDWLQMAVGYTLTGHNNEQCLFYLYGPTRAGKGVFLQTLGKLLGKPLGASVDFDTFTAHRKADNQNFDLAPLRPARLVTASESERGNMLNAKRVKAITGNDDIYCAFKGRDFFNYTPKYKIWLASNFPVMGDADDDALWGRVRAIKFPNSNLGKEDFGLTEKLHNPTVMQGVLAWAVEGAMQWYKALPTGGLGIPDLVKVETQKHRGENDTVAEFIADMCIVGDGKFCIGRELTQAYQSWCNENGLHPLGGRRLSEALRKRGFEKKAKLVNGKTHKAWLGVGLVV